MLIVLFMNFEVIKTVIQELRAEYKSLVIDKQLSSASNAEKKEGSPPDRNNGCTEDER